MFKLQLKQKIGILMLSFFSFVPVTVLAGELSEQASIKTLVDTLKAMKSLTADFHQWVNDAKQSSLQDVTGKLWVQRPGQFRWDTNEPYPQRIVANDDVIWVYDLDLDQVTKRKLGNEVGNTPALLLSGDPEKLSKSFDISAYLFDETKEYRFDLRPKGEEALFELLRVHFINGVLKDMYLQDSLGQTTQIEFSQQQQNQPILQTVFEFTPPEGVDVITDM